MIVCVCAGVSERQLRAVIADGAVTMREIERQCGAGAGCGACRSTVKGCLRECRTVATQATLELTARDVPELVPA